MTYVLLLLIIFSSHLKAADPGGLRNAIVFYSTSNQISTSNSNYVELLIGQNPKKIVEITPEYVQHNENGTNQILQRKKTEICFGPTAYPNPPKTNTTQKSCSTVDLASKMGPVKNQLAFNCYAYAATEVLSFDQPNGPYSPTFLSTMMRGTVGYNNERPILSVKGFDGGHASEAMKEGLKIGMCSEKLAKSEKTYLNDYVKIVEYYKKSLDQQNSFEKYCEDQISGLSWLPSFLVDMNNLLEEEKKKSKFFFHLWNTSDIERNISAIFPSISSKRMEEIFLVSKTPNQFFRNLSIEACKGNLEKIPPNKNPSNVKSLNAYSFIDGKEYVFDDARVKMVDDINSNLSQGKPIALSFTTIGLLFPSQPNEHGNHAATIAGRRWKAGTNGKAGECVYLVKNSWGEDWKIPAGVKASKSKYSGYFELTENQLLEHAYGISYLD